MNALIILALAGSFAGAEAVDAGKAAYAAKCASCHAKDGKGNAMMAKMFKVEPVALNLASEATQKKKDADLVKIVADGKGKMPAFKEKLKEGEIAGLVSYLRSFVAAKTAEKAAPKPADPQK